MTRAPRGRGGRLAYIPIRHGPLPVKPETAEHADLRHVLGTVAGVATGVTVWLVADSVVLAVFWALVVSYVVATIAPTRPREPLIRRVAVAVLPPGSPPACSPSPLPPGTRPRWPALSR